MIVVSGSVNAVSLAQQRYAAGRGFPRFTIPPEQKLDPGFPQSGAFRRLCGDILAAYRQHRQVLVEAVDSVGAGARGENGYCLPGGMSPEEARATVAGNLGKLAAALQSPVPGEASGAVTVIIGGDTLLALIRESGGGCLIPIAEPLPGVVLSSIERPGGAACVISKSGGFGEEDFLLSLRELLLKQG
jgi:uncharacterized protein YgbK (DUF1537 family)